MEKNEKTFTLKEVERLVKNAYEVGLCDGADSVGSNPNKEYLNADDFWNKNIGRWLTQELKFVA